MWSGQVECWGELHELISPYVQSLKDFCPGKSWIFQIGEVMDCLLKQGFCFYLCSCLPNVPIPLLCDFNYSLHHFIWSEVKWSEVKSLSHVQLFATPWTVAYQAPQSMGFPGKSTGVGCHFLLQGIIPTQGSNLGLLHCRQMLYHLNYQGSLR